MGDTTQYVQFGFILITVTNLIIIGLLILVFALAVVLRRPGVQQVSIIEPLPTQVAEGVGATGSITGLEEQP
jgi:hypothetical protein